MYELAFLLGFGVVVVGWWVNRSILCNINKFIRVRMYMPKILLYMYDCILFACIYAHILAYGSITNLIFCVGEWFHTGFAILAWTGWFGLHCTLLMLNRNGLAMKNGPDPGPSEKVPVRATLYHINAESEWFGLGKWSVSRTVRKCSKPNWNGIVQSWTVCFSPVRVRFRSDTIAMLGEV